MKIQQLSSTTAVLYILSFHVNACCATTGYNWSAGGERSPDITLCNGETRRKFRKNWGTASSTSTSQHSQPIPRHISSSMQLALKETYVSNLCVEFPRGGDINLGAIPNLPAHTVQQIKNHLDSIDFERKCNGIDFFYFKRKDVKYFVYLSKDAAERKMQELVRTNDVKGVLKSVDFGKTSIRFIEKKEKYLIFDEATGIPNKVPIYLISYTLKDTGLSGCYAACFTKQDRDVMWKSIGPQEKKQCRKEVTNLHSLVNDMTDKDTKVCYDGVNFVKPYYQN